MHASPINFSHPCSALFRSGELVLFYELVLPSENYKMIHSVPNLLHGRRQ